MIALFIPIYHLYLQKLAMEWRAACKQGRESRSARETVDGGDHGRRDRGQQEIVASGVCGRRVGDRGRKVRGRRTAGRSRTLDRAEFLDGEEFAVSGVSGVCGR